MHLYPKQSRQFRPGLTSSCKPPTPVSQTLLTFGRDDVVKRQSDGLGQALLTPHQNGSAKAHRSTFSPGTYNVTCSSYNPFYSHPKFKEEVPTYIQIIRNKTHLQPEKIPNLQPPYPKRCWSTLATITSSIGCLLLLKQRLLHLYILTTRQSNPTEFPERYLWGWYGELWCLALATIPWFIRILYLGILDGREEQRIRRIRDVQV